MSSTKEIVKFLVFITLVTALLFELSLHTLSYVLSDHRVTDPAVDAEDQNLIRILALGESTTDPVFARLQNAVSWPEQLEAILNKNKKKFKVYNLGRSSVNTFYFANRIEQLITTYQPHIMISMLGINDNPYHSSFEEKQDSAFNFVKVLRRTKIFQFYFWYNHLYQFEWNSFHFGEKNEKLLDTLFLLQESQPAFSFNTILEKMKFDDLSESDQHFLLTLLTYKVLVNSNKSPKNTDLVNQIFQYLDAKKYVSRDLELSKIYYFALLRQEEKCFNFVEYLVFNNQRVFTETEMGFVLGCVKGDLLLAEKWVKLLKDQPHFTNISLSQHSTFQNYSYLIKQAQSRKIKHLVMQYPLRPVTQLEDLLGGAKLVDVVFVENSLNFKKVLSEKSYSEVFTDRMAYDFGHLTSLGHSLIASNLSAILKDLNQD